MLEEADSDVLILLDCCCAGIGNNDEGRGVTELIAAGTFDSAVAGMSPMPFTVNLTLELRLLSRKSSFSIGELYNRLFTRVLHHIPERGGQRYLAPVHLVLT